MDARLGDTPDFDLRFSPLPKTLKKVAALMVEEGDIPNTPELAAVVSADPILALFVLRRINSVYHGVRRSIEDISQAVRLLGFQEVCTIVEEVRQIPDEDVLVTEEQAQVYEDIMKISLGASFLARALATQLDLSLKDYAYVVGLQHAVGRFVLLQNRSSAYAQLWRQAVTGFAPSAIAERKLFGIDHAELGARALKRWNFSESVTSVIGNYTRPGTVKGAEWRALAMTLAVAVAAAEQLCQLMAGRSSRPFFTPPSKIVLLGMSRATKVSSDHIISMVHAQRDDTIRYIRSML